MFIPDKQTNGFVPDSSFQEEQKTTGFLDRLKLSFGSKEAREGKVEPRGISEGFKQKGFLGGLKELGSDFADVAGAALPFTGAAAGAVGGTVLGTPVGGVAGASIGAGAGEAARQAIGRFLGVRNDKSIVSEIKDISVSTASTFAGGKLGGYVLGRFPKLLGIFSGEGDDAIRAALKVPAAADKGLQQGDEAIRNLVTEGSKKSIQLRTSFIDGHNTAFNDLAKSFPNKLLSRQKILYQFTDNLVKESAKIKNGVIDFSTSKIITNPGEIGKINNAYKAIQAWDDWSLMGVNKLKQLIGGLTKFADEAGVPSKSPFLGKFYNFIDNSIKSSLPKDAAAKYSVMNKVFSDTIDLFDDTVNAFNKGDPFTKLANALGSNKDSLKRVLEFYDKLSGQNTLATIAGRTLGQEKTAAFGFLNPRSWVDFFISPKLQGQIITRAGKLSNPVKGASERAYNAYRESINSGFDSFKGSINGVVRNLNFKK